jgi:hypothetical protein
MPQFRRSNHDYRSFEKFISERGFLSARRASRPATGVHLKGGHVSAVGPAPAGANQALQNCVTKVGATYHELVTYQPPGHYWPLQWYELAIYLGAALVIGGICLWRIRRNVS